MAILGVQHPQAPPWRRLCPCLLSHPFLSFLFQSFFPNSIHLLFPSSSPPSSPLLAPFFTSSPQASSFSDLSILLHLLLSLLPSSSPFPSSHLSILFTFIFSSCPRLPILSSTPSLSLPSFAPKSSHPPLLHLHLSSLPSSPPLPKLLPSLIFLFSPPYSHRMFLSSPPLPSSHLSVLFTSIVSSTYPSHPTPSFASFPLIFIFSSQSSPLLTSFFPPLPKILPYLISLISPPSSPLLVKPSLCFLQLHPSPFLPFHSPLLHPHLLTPFLSPP